MAELDRHQSDYVYLTRDLISLQGRKSHRERSHIKPFKENYSYPYTSTRPEWISECLRLQTEGCDLRHCEIIPGLANKSVAIREASTHFELLKVHRGTSGQEGHFHNRHDHAAQHGCHDRMDTGFDVRELIKALF